MQPMPDVLHLSLNVYNYTSANCLLEMLGIGLYHTGLVVKQTESQFSNVEYQFICCSDNPLETGMCGIAPGTGDFPLARNIPIAAVPIPYQRFYQIHRYMEAKYVVGSYHVFRNNCNHFVAEFVRQLTGIELPAYFFRMTNFLGMFDCCLPATFLNGQDAYADYVRNTAEQAQQYLSLRDRIKIDMGITITQQSARDQQKQLAFA